MYALVLLLSLFVCPVLVSTHNVVVRSPDTTPWSPWGPREGDKIEQVLLTFRTTATVTHKLSQRPDHVTFFSEPRKTQIKLTFNYKVCCLTSRLDRVFCLKADTCVSVTNLSPQAILWTEHSRIQNKHLSQRACVSFNRVQIECLETVMLFISSCRDFLNSLPVCISGLPHSRSLRLLKCTSARTSCWRSGRKC